MLPRLPLVIFLISVATQTLYIRFLVSVATQTLYFYIFGFIFRLLYAHTGLTPSLSVLDCHIRPYVIYQILLWLLQQTYTNAFGCGCHPRPNANICSFSYHLGLTPAFSYFCCRTDFTPTFYWFWVATTDRTPSAGYSA